jgi:hypothetical protein
MGWAKVQVRISESEPSSNEVLRQIHKTRGVEWVYYENARREVMIDPALDVYFLVLRKDTNNALSR